MICDWHKCGIEFTPPPSHPGQRFHSARCRIRYHQDTGKAEITRDLGHDETESSGYTQQRPRISTAAPLPSCEHCRAWGTIHAEFCPNRRRKDSAAAHRVAVEVARALADGYQISPTVAAALMVWLDTAEAQSDPDVLEAAKRRTA